MRSLRKLRMPFPQARMQDHDYGQSSQNCCHGTPAENKPGAPAPPCLQTISLSHRTFRGQGECCNLPAFRAMGKMIQHLRAFPFHKGLLHKCREQVSVGMLGTLESLRPQSGAGGLRRAAVCLQPRERDFGKSTHVLSSVQPFCGSGDLPSPKPQPEIDALLLPSGLTAGFHCPYPFPFDFRQPPSCRCLPSPVSPTPSSIMERFAAPFLALIGGAHPRRVR